jgi:DNA polymerase I-like protein with 3'-5' exonuclease and polymerase domains
VAELVQNEMSGVVKLRVPLEVQVGFGPNWSAAAH